VVYAEVDMDSRIASLLPDLEARLTEKEAEIAVLRQAVAGLRGLANGTMPQAAHANGSTGNGNGNGDHNGSLRGREAILAIAAEKPNAAWKVQTLAKELLKRGWVSSPTPRLAAKSAQNAVSRMVADGEAERVRPGFYRFHTNGKEAA
jgi:hypothetical protein